jgi:hypothetical protein
MIKLSKSGPPAPPEELTYEEWEQVVESCWNFCGGMEWAKDRYDQLEQGIITGHLSESDLKLFKKILRKKMQEDCHCIGLSHKNTCAYWVLPH